MTWKYTDEYYKEYTRQTWNESADVYQRLMTVLEPFGQDLLARVRPAPGERVLDVATGPGEPALTVARQVGPGGHVLGIDLSEKMIDLALRRAKDARAENADFRVMDAEKLEVADGTFDVVLSRFGFQIVTNPEVAAREALRVLKPGGRIGLSVWSTGDRTPGIHVMVGPMLENAEPDETGYLPTPYELGGPGELVAMLVEQGFRDAEETRVVHDWTFRDEEDYLDVVLKGTPLGHSLSEEEPDVQKEVLRKTRENLRAYKTPAGIRMPSECVLVTARK